MISYLLIILIGFSAVGVSVVQLVGEYLLTQRIRDDRRIVESTAAIVSPSVELRNASELYTTCMESARNYGGRFLVLDRDGIVQIDTDSELTGTSFSVPEVNSIRDGGNDDYGFYDTGSNGEFWLHAALSFYTNVKNMHALYTCRLPGSTLSAGILVYITSVQEIYTGLRSIQLRILSWLLIVAILVLIVSSLIMRSFTIPLGELNEGIRKMSSGDLSSRISVRGKNEFSELAIAFNTMSERLETLDNSRSAFVSNASHELKTPLSAMKILIESLIYQDPLDPGMAREFLGDINHEIDRLNRIVSDLLTLVNLDSDSTKLNLTTFSLNTLISEQVRRLLPLARENGIEINFEAADEITLSGDTLKLQQVFYNVIDNAIKYTPRGGEVNATLERSGRNAVIRIADTGIGIPAADIEHIFDRFYRVDKARSRATGGTGLGLSIVKQIIQKHGGSISATSTEGKGTTFEIILPVNKS